jgi:hypothetical protein
MEPCLATFMKHPSHARSSIFLLCSPVIATSDEPQQTESLVVTLRSGGFYTKVQAERISWRNLLNTPLFGAPKGHPKPAQGNALG